MPEPDAPSPCAFVQGLITSAINRVRVARWIGEQAVSYGRREIAKVLQESAAAGRGAGSSEDDGGGASGASEIVDPSAVDDLAVVDGGDGLTARVIVDPMAVDDVIVDPAVIGVAVDVAVVDQVPLVAVISPPVGSPPGSSSQSAAPPEGGSSTTVPFEGYDTLPAAHIVQRLARLAAAQLRGVRAYEVEHRNRRTVLAKVDQLLGG